MPGACLAPGVVGDDQRVEAAERGGVVGVALPAVHGPVQPVAGQRERHQLVGAGRQIPERRLDAVPHVRVQPVLLDRARVDRVPPSPAVRGHLDADQAVARPTVPEFDEDRRPVGRRRLHGRDVQQRLDPVGEPGDGPCGARAVEFAQHEQGRRPQRVEPLLGRRGVERIGRRGVEPYRIAVDARAGGLLDQGAQPGPVGGGVVGGGHEALQFGPVAGHDLGGHHAAGAHVPAGGRRRDHADDLAGVGQGDGGPAETGGEGLAARVPGLQLEPLPTDQLGCGDALFGEGALVEAGREAVDDELARCRAVGGVDRGQGGRGDGHLLVQLQHGEVTEVGGAADPAAVGDDPGGHGRGAGPLREGHRQVLAVADDVRARQYRAGGDQETRPGHPAA